MTVLDEILERITDLPETKRAELVSEAMDATKHMVWCPNPGPQSLAYLSEADEIGYGGEAGGGKTDLEVGLALTAHRRSLVLRRTNMEANKLVDRFAEILGNRAGWNSQENVWRLPGGRVIDIGGCQNEDDKQKYKGNPHDLIAFDEVVDFTESQYTFIIGWNRSTDEGQRCRVIATFNPPTRPVGMWVMKRWGPWLDPKHHRPAKSGELRWYTSVDGVDTEVDGAGPHLIDGKFIKAKSRTFIRAKLADNPDLARTDYASTLAGMPKELRAAYLEGRFDASLKDAPNQCIPTSWIRLAQQRWHAGKPEDVPMCAIGVDCSGGGEDPMMLAMRYDGWFDALVEVPGKDIPMARAGAYCAGIIVSHRQDGAVVTIDMGGGYGGAIYEHLADNDAEIKAYKGAEGTTRRSRDRKLGFTNTRSAAYWAFREALDPGQPGGSPIALPDDPGLLADLAAPTFDAPNNKIRLEAMEAICKRLGRSTDRGDAVVMAWFYGERETTAALEWAEKRERKHQVRNPQVVNSGRVPLSAKVRR